MWEYNAPQYVDFTKHLDDDRADAYFGMIRGDYVTLHSSMRWASPGCRATLHACASITSARYPDTAIKLSGERSVVVS